MKKTVIMFLIGTASIFTVSGCSDRSVDLEDAAPNLKTRNIDTHSPLFFKVFPGTDEWYNLENIEDRWNACQIDVPLLRDLSTEDLIIACEQFPMADYFIYYDDERGFISSAYEKFNGLKELAQREDGVTKLIDAYDRMFYSPDYSASTDYHPSFFLSMAYWELLLADPLIINRILPNEIEVLKKIVWEKMQMKMDNMEYFSLLDVKRSLMLLSVLALKSDKNLKESDTQLLQGFVKNYIVYNSNRIEQISAILK